MFSPPTSLMDLWSDFKALKLSPFTFRWSVSSPSGHNKVSKSIFLFLDEVVSLAPSFYLLWLYLPSFSNFRTACRFVFCRPKMSIPNTCSSPKWSRFSASRGILSIPNPWSRFWRTGAASEVFRGWKPCFRHEKMEVTSSWWHLSLYRLFIQTDPHFTIWQTNILILL